MNCPRCQMPIANPDEAFCPRCGYALQPLQSEAPTTSTPMDLPFASPPAYPAPVSPQMPSGPYLGYGAPPSGSLYGPGMPPYQPYSTYGMGAPATIPLPPPSWAPAPPAPLKRSTGVLVSLIIVLAVALVASSGAALYFALGRQSNLPAAGGPSAHAPSATASYNVIFQDPLTSNVNGWANDSHCFFANGGYHVKDGYICYASIDSVSDDDTSVQVQQSTGATDWFYGLVFRRTSRGNFYALLIASNGYWKFSVFQNDQRTDLIPYIPSAALHRGLHEKNTLEVRASGHHFQFFINDTKVGQDDDSTFSSGFVGVIGNTHIEAVFNNFSVAIPQ